jgi:hypothetical protein
MKKRFFDMLLVALSFILVYSCNSTPVSGFSIVEPKLGTVYHPGDRVTLKAVTGPNEQPIAVYLYATQMQHSELYSIAPYELTFTIPADFTGKDTLVASEKFSDGTIIEKEVEILVVLPSNVVLKSIAVDPKVIFLEKLPIGSDPAKVMTYETEDISVGGMYSDGVKRNITSSADGTTYTSSNEKVVTVSPEGDVSVQGVGTAKITVRNGKYSVDVEIIVDPYKE